MTKRPPLTTSPLRRPGAGVVPAPVSADDNVKETKNGSSLRERAATRSIYISVEADKQLKRLALDRDCKVHDLLIDAINDLFAKHGLPQIAAA